LSIARRLHLSAQRRLIEKGEFAMASRRRTRSLIALLVAAGIIIYGSVAVAAADPAAPSARNSKAADSAGKDPFAVPNLKPPELLKWIQKGEKYQPQVNSQEELIDFMKKSRHALVEAADKILSTKTSETTRLAAIRSKRTAIGILEQAGDPDAAKMLKDFLDQIKDEKQPEVVRMVKSVGLKVRINEARADPAAFAKVWADLKTELNAATVDKEIVSMAIGFGEGIERRDANHAPQVLTELAEILSKSKDSKLTEAAKKFAGVARRITLLGKPVEIKGTLVDGRPFDQATVQGKVVLLDFWATWCPPCMAEFPNVKENYEKYHDKGFEVVGVSLDQSGEDLQKFLETEKVTWPILFSKEKKDQYWNNPLAVYYGVNAIPCAILTNQKGEVISLQAHGEELSRTLEQLLGKVGDKTSQVK
jgi:thiol-disulfide isomerase/thioredoxin